jgi:glycosyltransferase involved in cell wall biosynthesis
MQGLKPMESARPLVSVILPACNAEAFIGQTLESVLRQTYTHLEVLVVDDGSRDRTAEIVRTFAKRDSRVVLLQQDNRGVAAARNLAIQKSRGEFIAPVDADDLWFPEKLEKQVRSLMKAGPEVGLVYTWSLCIDERTRLLSSCARWEAQGDVLRALLFCNFVGSASVPLFRRSCLEQMESYYPDLRARNACGCEDWGLLLRIAERHHFAVVPEYLVGYRAVPGSMSTDAQSMARSYDAIISEVKARRPELPDELYRWSRSNFYRYLAGVCYGTANYRQSLLWIVRALRLDAAVWLSPWAYWVLGMSAIGLLLHPLTTLFFSRQSFLRFAGRALRARHRPVPSLAEVERISQRSVARRRLFSWVLDKRWARVTAKP